ncbi:MAG: flagellar filament capping protein FliD [Rhodocyclaceae bacterium]
MASTGTLTLGGMNLDIDTMVTKLMAVEQRPITTLQTKEASYKTQLSAFSTLKGTLSSLQTAAQTLNTTAKFAAFSATVADTAVASASANGSAAAGTYTLTVDHLAQAQKIKTGSYTSTLSTLPTGTLSIQTGTTDDNGFTATKTVNITVNSSNNTLQGIRDTINASGAGVTATMVNDGGSTPYRLVLTSQTTGTTNTFKMSGIDGLEFDPANPTGSTLTQIQKAENAKFSVDGIDFVKSTNSVSDAIDGVTLNLTKTNANAKTTLTISRDTSAMSDKVSAFVQAYNTAIQVMRSQTSYNADTKAAGTLNGDATVRGITQQLRTIMSTPVLADGKSRYLSDIGISAKVDGTLSIDNAKLTKALADPAQNVAAMFAKVGENNGIAAKIDAAMEAVISDKGSLKARTDGIGETVKTLDKRIEAMNRRLEAVEARYRAQFTALDTTLSNLNGTSSYLTQQLASLQSFASSSSK